ncbi:MAG: Holliday junction resolvase RuvX [Flavobacteriaceae bacterium]|nr:Holliday junction resolvase RuvX [Flavobacteriaceae bacterium]MDG1789904.1 Holliday junction resolvase RuvX [Flavobacteriaceae bacterium]MDG2446729.1 Holliday junction resolvase RuvX [Flavobacteriaceae bacterium]
MARLLAIDFGTKRTGIAITDEMQIIASGLTTVLTKDLILFLKDYVSKENVELVIIGEPKQKDGTHSDVELHIKKFIKVLTNVIPTLKIERFDERFTSKIAFNAMIASGISKKKRKNKALIDEISATIILQDYLNKN